MSLYERQIYLDGTPFVEITLVATLKADLINSTIESGFQYVVIPEFLAIVTEYCSSCTSLVLLPSY